MTFINPQFLFLLILLPIAVPIYIWRDRVRRSKWLRLGDSDVLSMLMPSTSSVRRYWKFGLWLIVLASLIVALARPVWGQDVSVIETQGVSLIVVLDVSKSMNAQDVMPSRLERAKLAISDLFNDLSGNQLGLILFAGSAFVQFPLTVDTISAQTFLNAANVDAVTRQGTNLEAALRLALDSFSDETGAQRIIVLVTDGEGHEGDPLKVADMAADSGVVIDAIGYGNPEGAAIPLRDVNGHEVGYQTDREGNLVLSALDEPTLKSIAERTGGTYQRETPSGQEINNLVSLIKNDEKVDLGNRTVTHGVERFGIFVALALAALSLEMILSESREARA